MSNAVDVMMVGGARSGRVVCMNRERMTSSVDFLGDSATNYAYTYTLAKRQLSDGKWYRFGYPTGEEEPSDATLESAFALANYQPSWDLNR